MLAIVYFGLDTSFTIGTASEAAAALLGGRADADARTSHPGVHGAAFDRRLLISLAGRMPNLREAVTLVTASLLLTVVSTLLPLVMAGARPGLILFEFDARPGPRLSGRAARHAVCAHCLRLVDCQFAVLDRLHARQQEAHQTRFFVCFALAIAATMGIAFSGNLFTLFIFYEVLTLSTYPLVTHAGTEKARDGGRVYLGLLLSTSTVFLLPALVFIWYIAGTTDFTAGGILADKLKPGELAVLLGLCVFGIGKAALMPFHRWLPAAMVAPTPVSALLHAVAVVKAGVFSVVKVMVYVFGIDTLATAGATHWLVLVAGFTIIAASVVALTADNLKRRLAYSTISQLSYVTMAAALLAPLSLVGAALHIAAHAVRQDHAVFCRGRHLHRGPQNRGQPARRHRPAHALDHGRLCHCRAVDDRPAPGRGLYFQVVHAVGCHGQPALAGGHVIVLSTLLNAGYFLPIVYRAFFVAPPADPHGHPHGEAPLADGDRPDCHGRLHGTAVFLS